jgi:anti-sigma factor RsiW
MGSRHWDDQELIERLYGLGPVDGHLDECEHCAGRFGALVSAREQVLAPPSVSEELMTRQRLAIRRSLETPGRNRRWLPYGSAVATAAVLLLAVLLYRPAPPPKASGTLSDAEFFAEVYSLAKSSEPVAAEPMHALFEEEQ